jgi:hypothetical protein
MMSLRIARMAMAALFVVLILVKLSFSVGN